MNKAKLYKVAYDAYFNSGIVSLSFGHWKSDGQITFFVFRKIEGSRV